MILASEDIGMADSSALSVAVAAAQTVQLIGMPEAQLTLAHATTYLATAPKSNAVTTALASAMSDIRAGKAGMVPVALRDGHYSGAARLAMPRVIGIRTMTRMVLWRNSIRPTIWWVPITTGRLTHGRERDMPTRLDKLRAIIRHRR